MALRPITLHYITLHCIWSKLGITLGWSRPSGGCVLLPQVASDGPDRPDKPPLYGLDTQVASDGQDRPDKPPLHGLDTQVASDRPR